MSKAAFPFCSGRLQIAALDESAGGSRKRCSYRRSRRRRLAPPACCSWINWPQRASLPGGCPIDAASRQYQHQPGPMRDAIVERMRHLEGALARSVALAIETGELAADTDPRQFAFEFLAVVLAFNRTELLFGQDEATKRARGAFSHLVERCQK